MKVLTITLSLVALLGSGTLAEAKGYGKMANHNQRQRVERFKQLQTQRFKSIEQKADRLLRSADNGYKSWTPNGAISRQP